VVDLDRDLVHPEQSARLPDPGKLELGGTAEPAEKIPSSAFNRGESVPSEQLRAELDLVDHGVVTPGFAQPARRDLKIVKSVVSQIYLIS
jgi:hypothetical protein